MMRSQKEKMLASDLYIAHDPELKKDFLKAKRLLKEFNQSNEEQVPRRTEILQDLFKKIGDKPI